MRVVLDANVLVSALLSRRGAPARLIELCVAGDLEIVLCDHLLAEVEGAVAALRAPIDVGRVETFLALLAAITVSVPDPTEAPPVRSADPADDYLVSLAARERVQLISGDRHLLDLAPRIPVLSPRAFVDELES